MSQNSKHIFYKRGDRKIGFSNLIPIFKKRKLFFKESYIESENVFSFVFEKDKDMTWKAGQYGLVSITHKKIKNLTKPFSLSSELLGIMNRLVDAGNTVIVIEHHIEVISQADWLIDMGPDGGSKGVGIYIFLQVIVRRVVYPLVPPKVSIP